MLCGALLAHLSWRLMGELKVYQLLRRPSINIFNISSETPRPIKLKIFRSHKVNNGKWAQISSGAPAGKGLTSWLLLVMFIVFLLLYWVRCGTWLYCFLIFAVFLTFTYVKMTIWFRSHGKNDCHAQIKYPIPGTNGSCKITMYVTYIGCEIKSSWISAI